ncbi:MAG: YabP/YqfC family sporulation protein [Clostridiales bacterium]|nr:YabP/YqfC family sporulation protein [Clostridiales bacterium]
MSFIEQTAKLFGNAVEIKFHAIMFGRDGIYIEGAKPMSIDKCEMIFRTPRCILTVTGDGMTVKDLTGDCTAIVGRIDGVSVKDI